MLEMPFEPTCEVTIAFGNIKPSSAIPLETLQLKLSLVDYPHHLSLV